MAVYLYRPARRRLFRVLPINEYISLLIDYELIETVYNLIEITIEYNRPESLLYIVSIKFYSRAGVTKLVSSRTPTVGIARISRAIKVTCGYSS